MADDLPSVAQVRTFFSRAVSSFSQVFLQCLTHVLPIHELEARSLGKSMFLRWERDVWDQLQQQKDLLANANELLSAQSVEVEDLRLCCANLKVEAATARGQAAPLAAWIKELEEELIRVAGERDSFEQFYRLAEQSLRIALSVMADDLPSVAQVRAFFSCAVSSFSRVFSQCLMFILPI